MNKIETLSDGDSNSIKIINRQFVEKKFVLKEQLNQEMAAYSLFQLVSPFRVPIVIDKNNDTLTLEFIAGKTGYELSRKKNLSRQEITRNIADFSGSVFWEMQFLPQKKKRLFPLLDFKYRINQLQKVLNDNRVQLGDLIGLPVIDRFKSYLKDLLKQPELFLANTLIHRDLHMGNMLIDQSESCVIDFEHALIGPIELEIQNAILWNDGYSIDPTVFRSEIINNMRVPYSISLEKKLFTFYVIDQIVLAFKRSEFTKIKLILNQYKKRLRN